jgi:hypothetical protein
VDARNRVGCGHLDGPSLVEEDPGHIVAGYRPPTKFLTVPASVVTQIPVAWREPVTAALRAVTAAVGELPDREWWLESQHDTTAAADQP